MTYLVARVLYADGMAALITLGATYAALLLDWNFLEMIVFALVSTACSTLGGYLAAAFDMRLGPKRALIIEITAIVFLHSLAITITPDALFLGLIENESVWSGPVFQSLSDVSYLSLTVLTGMFVLASLSSSRTLMVAMAPPNMRGEFFGLFAVAGTITVWIGPLMVEAFTRAFNSQRIGMASLSILFLAGLIILLRVKHDGRA